MESSGVGCLWHEGPASHTISGYPVGETTNMIQHINNNINFCIHPFYRELQTKLTTPNQYTIGKSLYIQYNSNQLNNIKQL